MTTYAALSATWKTLSDRVEKAMTDDKKYADSAVKQKMSQLNANANASRLHLVVTAASTLTNPVQALQLLSAAKKYAADQAAVGDMSNRAAELDRKGADTRSAVNTLLANLTSELEQEFAKGAATSEKFDKLTDDWKKVSADSEVLAGEMLQFGMDPSWKSDASGDGYRAAVTTQIGAVDEFKVFAGNTATISTGVANLQRAIYLASAVTMKAHHTTISDAANQSQSMTSRGCYYHGSLTARDTLTKLLTWLQDGRASRWATPSVLLSFNLLMNMAQVQALQGGWPHQDDHSGADAKGATSSGLAEMAAQDLSGTAATTTDTGQKGTWHTL